jgi:hypothetical protein
LAPCTTSVALIASTSIHARSKSPDQAKKFQSSGPSPTRERHSSSQAVLTLSSSLYVRQGQTSGVTFHWVADGKPRRASFQKRRFSLLTRKCYCWSRVGEYWRMQRTGIIVLLLLELLTAQRTRASAPVPFSTSVFSLSDRAWPYLRASVFSLSDRAWPYLRARVRQRQKRAKTLRSSLSTHAPLLSPIAAGHSYAREYGSGKSARKPFAAAYPRDSPRAHRCPSMGNFWRTAAPRPLNGT